MKHFVLSVIGIFIVQTLHSQIPNRPVPAEVPPYEFVLYDTSNHGYYLTAPFQINATTTSTTKPAMILDSEGYLAWYMPLNTRFLLDFKYNAEHQLYQYINSKGPQQVQYVMLDTDFNPIDSFTTVNNFRPDIHEFQITSNHTTLIAGVSDSMMDLSGYLFNGQAGNVNTRVLGYVVQAFDEAHQLLFQWNSNDHIHPGETFVGYSYSPMAFDYCHGNAIEEDSDGNLLLSFRNLNAVYKIDRQTGEVLWTLGGQGSTFAFSNDAGFSGQHDVRRLPNGHISVFDNANMASPPRRSRAVEYALDTVNGLATKVWDYQYVPGVFSIAMGGHQTTPDRHHLVNYGITYRPEPTFVLTDDDGNKISELFLQDSFMSYRSFVSDLPHFGDIQRPVITCSQSDGVFTLSATAGYASYAWSTGESTSSINLSGGDTYQVWVNHGVGMLGSEPYVLQDLNMCPETSHVPEVNMEDRQTIIAYYDLLGRQVNDPWPNQNGGQILVVRYRDGHFQLRHY